VATGNVDAMILEHALITVRPDSHQEFEAALARARQVIAGAPGFRSLRLSRGIETPDRYLLLVEWETLEDHTVGFRESDRFVEWRSHIGPFFDSPPEVDHFDPVAGLA
jgi:heme-degrading monooxygenase HmoA